MKLKNQELEIEFADAGEIRTQRFDRTAMVRQVVLNGTAPFCTPEQVLPGRRTTDGFGLCGEFVLDGPAEQAKAGEWFCKPGVGLLRQISDNQPYDMWKTYEIRPCSVTVQAGTDGVLFRQTAEPQAGYGVDIEKEFRLEGNRLILDIRVRNAGNREICLKEYQHNFLSLGLPVSEGYVLELGCDRELAQIGECTLRQGDEIRLPSAVRVEGDRVLWEKDMEGCVLYHRSDAVDAAAPYGWTLRHLRRSLSVAEQTSFCPSRIDVWSVEHCVCPELYNSVTLKPGEAAAWQRIWTFTC